MIIQKHNDCSGIIPANTKHLNNICTMLDRRRIRCADVVQMLCKCFVFAGIVITVIISHISERLDTFGYEHCLTHFTRM